jgi:hypothetical protein
LIPATKNSELLRLTWHFFDGGPEPMLDHGVSYLHAGRGVFPPAWRWLTRRVGFSFLRFGVYPMNWKVCVSSAAVCVALAASPLFFHHHEVTFRHLPDAKAALAAAGYFCISDSSAGEISTGFLISRQAIAWHEAGSLCKAGPMGRAWQGKVWVTINPACWRLLSIPDQAGTRVWGDVIAFGDDELLREIDTLLSASASDSF